MYRGVIQDVGPFRAGKTRRHNGERGAHMATPTTSEGCCLAPAWFGKDRWPIEDARHGYLLDTVLLMKVDGPERILPFFSLFA